MSKKKHAGKSPGRTPLILGAVFVVALLGGWLWAGQSDAEAVEVVMYQNPSCGCCSQWAAHMENNGFDVEVVKTGTLNDIKRRNGLDASTAACHTAFVDDYIVEGHVPAEAVHRLLEEQPGVTGITVPGMPVGSPGMEGPNPVPYDVLTFDETGQTEVFARY